MTDISQAILGAADSPWVYVLGFLAVTISALLPPVPSTSLYVALAAIAAHASAPDPWLLIVSMVGASLAGDSILYALGRRFPPSSWRLLRGPKRQRALDFAEARLAERPSEIIVTSRFIPLGRLTVGLVSGATRVAAQRFVVTALAAGIVWAGYSVGVGYASAVWLPLPTIVTVLVAILFSIALGKFISFVLDWWDDHREARAAKDTAATD